MVEALQVVQTSLDLQPVLNSHVLEQLENEFEAPHWHLGRVRVGDPVRVHVLRIFIIVLRRLQLDEVEHELLQEAVHDLLGVLPHILLHQVSVRIERVLRRARHRALEVLDGVLKLLGHVQCALE